MTGPALAPVLIVSGTGTEVGKTVVTAAIAALAADRAIRVAVVKPAQTGEPPGPPGICRPSAACPASPRLMNWPGSVTRCPPKPPPEDERASRLHNHIYVTPAGFIRGRHGSRGLALAAAFTGILSLLRRRRRRYRRYFS